MKDEHYRIDPASFDANTKTVTLCAYCEKKLFYTRCTSKLPPKSLALHDPGTVPDSLTMLSDIEHFELLAIFNELVYTSVFRRDLSLEYRRLDLKDTSMFFLLILQLPWATRTKRRFE